MSKIDFGQTLMNPDNASIAPMGVSGPAPDPAIATRLPVTIDNLVPYGGNPRTQENPEYEAIKESIRNRGLDHPPNITRERPDQPYMIRDGGNTRLKALKELWEETQDPKFFTISCMFHPWKSEMDVLLAHVVENEMRGRMSFIDRARVAMRLKGFMPDGDELSVRQLATRITEMGWTLRNQNLSAMIYAYEVLLPWLPNTLDGGMGRPAVMSTRKMLDALTTYWSKAAMPQHGDISRLWQPVFLDLDQDLTFSADRAQPLIEEKIAKALDFHTGIVRAEIQAIQSGITQADDEIPRPSLNASDSVKAEPIDLWAHSRQPSEPAKKTLQTTQGSESQSHPRNSHPIKGGNTQDTAHSAESEPYTEDTAENPALWAERPQLTVDTHWENTAGIAASSTEPESMDRPVGALGMHELKFGIYSGVCDLFESIDIDTEATVWCDEHKPFGVWIQTEPLRNHNPIILLAYQLVLEELAVNELIENPLDHIESVGHDGWNTMIDCMNHIGNQEVGLFWRTIQVIRDYPGIDTCNYQVMPDHVMLRMAESAERIRKYSTELAVRAQRGIA